MLYYRVKADCDNYPRFAYIGKSNKVKRSGSLVGHELYTPAEREKIANSDKFFEKVEISKRKIYWLFGARLEDKGGYAI